MVAGLEKENLDLVSEPDHTVSTKSDNIQS